nr:MAG TPA: hypothetical protein [Herelleviridae sp.]
MLNVIKKAVSHQSETPPYQQNYSTTSVNSNSYNIYS